MDSEYSELSERTVRQHTMIEILKGCNWNNFDHSEPFEARPNYVPDAVDEDAGMGIRAPAELNGEEEGPKKTCGER